MITARNRPPVLPAIEAATNELGFNMASNDDTGALLRTLVASKPGGRIVELGTGTGFSTAWLLDGMDADARLVSVDESAEFQAVAREHLHDPRCEFVTGDGGQWILAQPPESIDFVFADAWSGKYTHLDETIALLKPGALYLVDDLLPQSNWPDDHPPKVERYLAEMEARTDLHVVRLDWGTGHLLASKI